MDRMLPSPKPNVFSHTTKGYPVMMLTLHSFTNDVREATGAVERYRNDNVTARISNRQYTEKSRGYERPYKTSQSCGWSTHTAAEFERSEILEWISNIPYTSHHKHISEGRLKGTGEWLFEREEYRTWRSSSASKLLLLRGIRMFSFFLHQVPVGSFLTSFPI